MEIFNNCSLKPYNTFGIDVSAKMFAEVSSLEDLKEIFSHESWRRDMLILGGGSNVLLTNDYDGMVVRNGLKGIELLNEDEEFNYVRVAGGENWHEFVLHCIENNYSGVENLSLIPGSVGAAPMQNIGAYGVEIKDVFMKLEAMHIEDGTIESFDADQCKFGYRESIFKNSHKGKYFILNMILRLPKVPRLNTNYGAIEEELEKMGVTDPTIKDVSDAVIAIRSSKLPNPAEIGNAGSFFKNPIVKQEDVDRIKAEFPDMPSYPSGEKCKLAAGWLIEQAGWKGVVMGNYGVHDKQALVLVNFGGAQGSDIFQLSEDIKNSVLDKFGVELEREVNVI